MTRTDGSLPHSSPFEIEWTRFAIVQNFRITFMRGEAPRPCSRKAGHPADLPVIHYTPDVSLNIMNSDAEVNGKKRRGKKAM